MTWLYFFAKDSSLGLCCPALSRARYLVSSALIRNNSSLDYPDALLNEREREYIFRRIGTFYLGETQMSAEAEMLKATEAAAVAGVSVRDVNRAIDEGILPDYFVSVSDGRQVNAAACTILSFYFAKPERLTSDERLSTIEKLAPRLSEWSRLPMLAPPSGNWNWVFVDEFLTIDLAPFVERMTRGLGKLAAARKIVESSKEILSGTPVIKGTRVPVHDVAASVEAGLPIERILESYPALDAEKVELATVYAKAYPLLGRPPGTKTKPEHATTITARRVSRRKKAE